MVLEVLIKTTFWLFWSITSKPLGLLKFQCHFWVPWTICFKMYKLFCKKVLTILRSLEIEHKTYSFLVRGAVPPQGSAKSYKMINCVLLYCVFTFLQSMETKHGANNNIPVKPTTYESRHAMDGKFTFIDQRWVNLSSSPPPPHYRRCFPLSPV